MTLLGMTTAELKQKIEAELSQNPALELLEARSCRTCGRTLVGSTPCSICSRPHNPDNAEPIVFTSARQDFYVNAGGNTTNSLSPEDLPDDNISPEVDLASYVLRQIAPELAEQDRGIAAHILTSLDEDGLLPIPLFEISRYHHVSPERVGAVLELIQHSEPIGVGAGSPQEALLIQLNILEQTQAVPQHAERAIREGMHLLSRYHYAKLGQLLDIPPQEAEAIAQFISANLNPYPGRSHWGSIRQGSEAHPEVYHHPDIVISMLNGKSDGPLVVELLFPLWGSLRIQPLFRREIKNAPKDKAAAWHEDLERANLLIKCLRQRENTMQQLATEIAREQRGFILRGDRHSKPMTRASIADRLGVHESTISRAVSGKTAQLPNGRIIPLSKFFDRSLHIRAQIREIIMHEKNALTDAQIADMLKEYGHDIARRTVAKYRSMEGILSARTRQRVANPSNG